MADSKPEERRFKPGLSHLYPVILSLGITGVLGYPILSPAIETTRVTPFSGDTFSGASLNALYFVAALGITATAMLVLVRRGKLSLLKQFVKVAVVFVCFTVTLWYISIVLSLLPITISDSVALDVTLALSVAVALVLGYFVFGKGKNRQLAGVILLSSLTGVFLGRNIPTLTVLILSGALVIYDIVAVFRGPVGALARTMEVGDLPGAMFNYKELTIGMGDMVFYSLLAMTAEAGFGPLSFLGAGIGIVGGTFLGFKALQRYEMFPGLPFSLLLGIAGMFAGWQIPLLL
jgi:presenilin-like A22 family membrane protease